MPSMALLSKFAGEGILPSPAFSRYQRPRVTGTKASTRWPFSAFAVTRTR